MWTSLRYAPNRFTSSQHSVTCVTKGTEPTRVNRCTVLLRCFTSMQYDIGSEVKGGNGFCERGEKMAGQEKHSVRKKQVHVQQSSHERHQVRLS